MTLAGLSGLAWLWVFRDSPTPLRHSRFPALKGVELDTSFFIPSSAPGTPLQASSEHVGQGLPGVRGAGEVQGQGVRRPGPDTQ